MNLKMLTLFLLAISAVSGLSFAAAPLPHSAVPSEVAGIIGRPLTPMSYAGVARRTTRRTVAVGAAAYGAGAVYGDPYGPYW